MTVELQVLGPLVAGVDRSEKQRQTSAFALFWVWCRLDRVDRHALEPVRIEDEDGVVDVLTGVDLEAVSPRRVEDQRLATESGSPDCRSAAIRSLPLRLAPDSPTMQTAPPSRSTQANSGSPAREMQRRDPHPSTHLRSWCDRHPNRDRHRPDLRRNHDQPAVVDGAVAAIESHTRRRSPPLPTLRRDRWRWGHSTGPLRGTSAQTR